MNDSRKYLLTGAVVLIAVVAVLLKYWDYVVNPWTRDGQVRAEVVQITPRVSGPIVQLAVKDNQFVKAGDLLFEIDPRTFEASLAQARAQYDKTGDSYLAQEKQVEAAAGAGRGCAGLTGAGKQRHQASRFRDRKEQGRVPAPEGIVTEEGNLAKVCRSCQGELRCLGGETQRRSGQPDPGPGLVGRRAEADLAETRANLGAAGDANASIREARAEVQQAELNLEFTQVRAPVDGYVTNLNLRLGSQAVANQPALALVDVNSFWIDGFFRETLIERIGKGDKAIVTLMAYPDKPLEGHVDSLGWGIAQQDGSTGFELLPNVSPTFEWIRLAQRVPVRIHLDELPEGVKLRVGTTCSVLVMTGSADSDDDKPVQSAPSALQ